MAMVRWMDGYTWLQSHLAFWKQKQTHGHRVGITCIREQVWKQSPTRYAWPTYVAGICVFRRKPTLLPLNPKAFNSPTGTWAIGQTSRHYTKQITGIPLHTFSPGPKPWASSQRILFPTPTKACSTTHSGLPPLSLLTDSLPTCSQEGAGATG